MREKHLAKQILVALACGAFFVIGGNSPALAAENTLSKAPAETIKASQLSEKWDKVFPENRQVTHHKVTFHNRYGLTLVGDLYMPKSMKQGDKLPAIAMAGPYGAVKEQVSGRYAQEMAARGFLTLAFDPSFTGRVPGSPATQPRRTSTPRTFRQR